MIRSSMIRHGVAAALSLGIARTSLAQDSTHPFGTLREQAEIQQRWLQQRVDTYLPALMRKYGIDMWVIPMREYNEDPVFEGIAAPTTFAARRRTIYVFFDRGPEKGVERIALGGSSQGGVFTAVRATREVNGVAGRTAELWGDQQWEVLKETIEARQPKIIGINKSRVFAFSDGLSSGELEGMSQALGKKWTSRFRPAEGLAVDFLALRLPEERDAYAKMQDLVWQMIRTMFSSQLITPGVTRTSDLVWWWRQHLNDLGLGTWFQPSVEIQRRGANDEQLGDNPVIERGDLLWCDVGITALRLNTDTQHDAYVLREGETDAPAGLKQALANSNRLQDLLFEEIRPGRTGNEVLQAVLTRMRAEGLDGTLYSHPIGLNGHGAGPLIGLWDYQEGVPGRGDHKVLANMWFSSELQVTSEVPEWDGQRVRMAQEEDFAMGADGKPVWIKGRQSELILVH
jgi:Xaa-Pro aminopeptidase